MNGNPFYEPYWDTELEHHGVKGMHWGERRTPEQLGHKPKKKRNSIIKSLKKKAAKRKAQAAKAKQKKKVQNEQKKEQLTEKQKEELREKLLKSSDPKLLAKHMDLLSTSEINERITRINTEQKLKDLGKDPKQKSKVDKGVEMIEKLGKVADSTSKIAKAYGDVYDATAKKRKEEYEREDKKNERRDKMRNAAEDRKARSEQDKQNREAMARFNSRLPEQIFSGLNSYSENKELAENLKIEFDSKTGKLTFSYKEKKDEKKK